MGWFYPKTTKWYKASHGIVAVDIDSDDRGHPACHHDRAAAYAAMLGRR
jgi:hypothetical protein